MRISENFVAATPKKFDIRGNFLRIDAATAGVDIDFIRAGQTLPENLRSATATWYAYPEGGFDSIIITSSGTQVVSFDVYSGRVGSDAVGGSVSILSAPSGAHVHAGVIIQAASAVILAANAARRYLCVQNQHATLDLFIRHDGAAAVADATAFRIPPGGVWEPAHVPTGAINGIRTGAAAAASVHVISA